MFQTPVYAQPLFHICKDQLILSCVLYNSLEYFGFAVVAYGLGQLDGMGTSWGVWGWSWLDIGLNPTAPFNILYFVFVCFFCCTSNT